MAIYQVKTLLVALLLLFGGNGFAQKKGIIINENLAAAMTSVLQLKK